MKTKAAVAWQAGAPLTIEEVDLDGPREGEVLVELNARLTEGFTPDELQVVARWLAQAAALEPGRAKD